ncbi:MAG: sugar ABC transporter permease [Clostridia bacterium]
MQHAQLAKKKRPLMTLSRKEAMTGWLFVTPAMVGFLVFTAFSMIYSLYISMTDWNILSDPKIVGFQNYINLFTRDIFFGEYLYNTFYYVVFLVPVVLAVSLFFALLLNKHVRGLTPFYRAALFLPCVVSTVAVALVWKWLLNSQSGTINGILTMLGVADPPQWLLDTKYAKGAIILMRIWQMSGYYMVMFLAGLQTIPQSLYEAARVDGASKWKQLWYITVPMLSPTTFAIVILLVLEAFNIFEAVMIMTQGSLGTSSLMYYVYTLAFENYRMGYASALAWVLFLMILVFTILRFVLKKDETM